MGKPADTLGKPSAGLGDGADDKLKPAAVERGQDLAQLDPVLADKRGRDGSRKRSPIVSQRRCRMGPP
jgi:hypothetical protein